jgi:hypothetical protein
MTDTLALRNASDRLDAQRRPDLADTLWQWADAIDAYAADTAADLDITDCPKCGADCPADVHAECPSCGDSPAYSAALNGTRIA